MSRQSALHPGTGPRSQRVVDGKSQFFRGAFWGVAFWFSLLLVLQICNLTVDISETAICKWHFTDIPAFGG